jgi:uridine kinase
MKETVVIYCKNNNTYKTYPIGISLLEIFKDMNVKVNYQVMAARVNRKMEDLHYLVYKPKDIEFIDISSSSGMRTYVRTLSLVLSKAIHDLFPHAAFRLEHPISKGYYCTIEKFGRILLPEDVLKIRARMQEIITLDLPIIREEKQSKEVIQLFRERGQMDKVLLLETLSRPYSHYFELDGYPDFYSGPLLPNTGYLKIFDLIPYYDGMLLRIPHRKNPSVLEEMVPQPKMFEIFKEYIEWNKIMGLSNVGDFNLACKEKRTYNLIKVSEALHEKKIAAIADKIYNSRETTRFVMISGPSSSGKTTFSKRLSVQIMVNGLNQISI